MSRTAEMFAKPPRAKPRVMMHWDDAGHDGVMAIGNFVCKRCRFRAGWLSCSEAEMRHGSERAEEVETTRGQPKRTTVMSDPEYYRASVLIPDPGRAADRIKCRRYDETCDCPACREDRQYRNRADYPLARSSEPLTQL